MGEARASTSNITIYDSTLREGEQMPGVRFTPAQKMEIAALLAEARVPQIEAGFAAVSEEERMAIRAVATMGLDAEILSLSRARKEDIDAAVSADVDMVLIFLATSELHMRHKLRMTREEVLRAVTESVDHAKIHGIKVGFSTEDTTRSEPEFLLSVYSAALESGADRLGITDTLGCATPDKIAGLVRQVRGLSEGEISVHLHNDFGLALSNALSAVMSGVDAVATTVCGFGERAGNVPLEQFTMAMKHLYGRDTGIRTELLTPLAQRVSAFAGINMSPTQPWVGQNAFAHESGIHVAAVIREPMTYECLPPETVGNVRRIVMGKHSGRSFVSKKLMEREILPSPDIVEEIINRVKSLGEQKGAISEDEFWGIVNIIVRAAGVRDGA